MWEGERLPIPFNDHKYLPGFITVTIKDRIDAEYEKVRTRYKDTLADIAAAHASAPHPTGAHIIIRVPRYSSIISADAPSDPASVEKYGTRIVSEYIMFTVTRRSNSHYKVTAGGGEIKI